MDKSRRVKYITVLDFEIVRVFQYKIGVNDVEGSEYFKEWNPDSESCEEFISNKGHNLSNCEWMVHETAQVITRNDYRDVVYTN